MAPGEREQVRGRSIVVKKLKTLPIEAVVRGYLEGSGWKEYRESQSVCGITLPPGLQRASKLPQPIFTPATKEEAGTHDENITFERMVADRGRGAREGSPRRRHPALHGGRGIRAHEGHHHRRHQVRVRHGRRRAGSTSSTRRSRRTPRASGRSRPTRWARARRASTSSTSATGSTRSASRGSRRRPPVPREVALKTSEKYQEALKRLAA